MEPINKNALRAAVLIHEQLTGGKDHHLPIYLPEYSWNNIQRLRRQIDRARERGWHRATTQLTEDLAGALDDCRRELENAARVLQSRPSKRQGFSASDIYRDILALYDEFEEVNIDMQEQVLSVTTDRIVLEYVHLGHFDIKLDWRRLGDAQPYRVVALDPNPARKSDDITHPHVQDEQLCEGEGRMAIRAALAECRLHDFFLLVSRLLHTYGKGSAYVELEAWDGASCEDCGAAMCQEDSYYCHHCDKTLCDSCSLNCQGCGESHCSDCNLTCAACGGDYCSSCLTTCPACRKLFCERCMEDGQCRCCHEKQRNQETHDDSPENTAIQPPAGRSRARDRGSASCVPA